MRPVPLLLPILVASCSAPMQAPATTSRSADVVSVAAGLRVAVSAPSRAPWDPDVLGAGDLPVVIRVENPGTQAVRVRPLRTTFRAMREGVAFPCDDEAEGSFREHEPSWLAPGQSHAFERRIDCAMTLPGTYDLEVFTQIGNARSERVAAFQVELEALRGAPKALPGRPGVFAIVIGRKATRPMPPEAWARGDYHVDVALINGSSRPVTMSPASISFFVYRKGSTIPCAGAARPVAFPGELFPGTFRLAQAPITCAPSTEGKYEIAGYLSLDDHAQAIEIGRLGLRVTSDPKALVPEPWSLGDRWPVRPTTTTP